MLPTGCRILANLEDMTRTENATQHETVAATAAKAPAPAPALAAATATTTTAATTAATATPPWGPWSVRSTPHRNGRATLEVYEHGELLDVMVTSALSSGLLRGARRGARNCAGHRAGRCTGRCARHSAGHPARGGQPVGFAWGRLPRNRVLPTVAFTGGRLSRRRQPARLFTLSGEFWLAWAEELCGGVLVGCGDESPLRLRTGRAC
ncbi:hypothetical protein GCM10009760_17210 [Kitasatospora kazusensis]|uniref:Uncharacterized protein n=1 Tax=Kitasatospora kazusensis TaxID=407974 RepID=A0ABP5KWC3_9ACTN